MSFQYVYCPKCGSYEFYQRGNIVPPCPHCGWTGYNQSREEYYRSFGIKMEKRSE